MVRRLFGEVGVDTDNASVEHLAEEADKMIAELPDRLRSMLTLNATKVQQHGSRKPETA